jgi:ketosteroid isomerase-like protein
MQNNGMMPTGAMQYIDAAFAREFADEWIAAWNGRDLDRVLAHYTEDFEFTSPVIVKVANEPSGVLRGKPAVRVYWEKALASISYLHFNMLDLLIGINTVTIYYRGHRGNVAETFHFNADRKVQRAGACYTNY